MNNRISAIKFIVIFILFSIIVLSGVNVYKNKISKKTKGNIITTGMTKGQNEYFQGQLSEAIILENLIKKGKRLIEKEKYNEAIIVFNEVFNKAKWQGDKGRTILYLADAYEKKREYKKALEYVILDRDKYINDWAKAPLIERAKYLEYASKGEYELAVKYAEKALEVETNMPYNKGVPSQGFIDRLNDLKAAKDYILSLKDLK